ncbi:MAG: Outer rane lipoprotein omp10 Minor outer membrane protein omp10 [Pseudomonadota bacterium]
MSRSNLLGIVLLTCLAGCQTMDVSLPQPQPVEPKYTPTADGDWVDTSGIVSSFRAGTFTTRTTDSNQVLASGTYVNTSPTLVEINMTSHLRKTQSKVNCQLVTANQLNCTSQTGAQFSLARRATNAAPLAPLPNDAATVTPAPATPAPAPSAEKKLPVLVPGQSAKL